MALTDNIVAYYKMDGDSTDATGNGHTGSGTNVTYSATHAVINQAVNLPGTGGSQVLVPNNAGFNGTTAATFSAWVYFTTLLGTTQSILSKCTSNGSAYMAMWKFSTNKFSASFDTGNGSHQITGGTTVLVNTRYHVVATYDGTTVSLYVNGVSDATPITASFSMTPGTGSVGIGVLGDLAAQRLDGIIDEVGWWSRAISSSEVTQLYNSGAGLQYPFSSGPVPSVNDSITVTESVIMKIVSFISVSDSITVTDIPTVTIPLLGPLNVSDSITVTESVQLQVISFINVFETISVTESTQIEVIDFNSISDTITVSEFVQMEVVSFVNVVDSIAVTDSTIINIVGNPSVSDTITVSESVQMEIVSFINTNDVINLTESVVILIIDYSSVFDTVVVTESVKMEAVIFINVSDTIIVTDLVTVTGPPMTLSVFETVTVSDFVNIGVKFDISAFKGTIHLCWNFAPYTIRLGWHFVPYVVSGEQNKIVTLTL